MQPVVDVKYIDKLKIDTLVSIPSLEKMLGNL